MMTAAAANEPLLDDLDRKIVNALQGGFSLVERPFLYEAALIGTTESDLIRRIRTLLDKGVLTRFGPLFNADRMGGTFCLCAMAVPADRFNEVAALVNSYIEVAHNYEREHHFNMWFVLAVEDPNRIDEVLAEIERRTGIAVLPFPKEEEFFIEFKVEL